MPVDVKRLWVSSFIKSRNQTKFYLKEWGRDSSVGIAATLRTRRSEDRIPVESKFFAPVQTCSGAHPASCTMVLRLLPGGGGGVSGRGVALNTNPPKYKPLSPYKT
jgi:hypothetical protein